MNNRSPVLRLVVVVFLAALILAGAAFPAVGGTGYFMARTADDFAVNTNSVINKAAPGISTLTDKDGDPFAWVYEQRRINVTSDQIAPIMKKALVAVEDRRFYDHGGVDWKGTIRAAVKNFSSGSVQEGASTIDQQLIKNHNLLVEATTDAERRAATATDYGRKLREIRVARNIEGELTKDEILTKYLNLVPFGNGAFGVETAAHTYFGRPATQLDIPQAALLAGMVQQSSGLDPYTNPEGALARRNDVLAAMESTGAINTEEYNAAKNTELGVLPQPASLPQGCIAAGDIGFFCDYALDYLASHGFDNEKIARGGYTIKTTLDPQVQQNVQRSLREQAASTTPGVAEVMNVIEPGDNSRRVLAMASSREYGLDLPRGQTVQKQPFTLVGNGAGSIFKIFAAASAVEKGLGIDSSFPVPKRYEASGLGTGGADNCPEGLYCVENTGNFPPDMTLRQALAKSPNTPFIQISELVSVEGVTDMAVRLGMRSYKQPGSFDGESSIAEYVSKHKLGSFVLGPTPVNNLELSNVAATLASNGRWCEPNPIESITDASGNEIALDTPECEEAVSPEVAHAVANALSDDTVDGTAKDAAESADWIAPISAKTGTTESNQSAAFLGFTSKFAASVYAYNDSPTVTQLCTTPLRQCGDGDLFGGREPALTWFNAMKPVVAERGEEDLPLPEIDPDYHLGTSITRMPDVAGMQEAEARKAIEEAGYKVEVNSISNTGVQRGVVVKTWQPDLLLKGGTVAIYVADGTRKPPPPPSPTPSETPKPRTEEPPVIDLPLPLPPPPAPAPLPPLFRFPF